jgi:hypothetical protein
MASIPSFFVVAFSRTKAREFRAEMAMTALSEQHAVSLVSHLAGEGGGAVSFSKTGDASTAGRAETKILARFGDLPDDGTLLRQFGDICAPPGRPDIMSASAQPVVRPRPLAHWLMSALSRILPFAAQREKCSQEGPRYSLAIAWVVAGLIAASGSSLLAISARAAQREARLVEMARPYCDHTGTKNEELHQLVRGEFEAGASKKDALRAVITL